MSEYLHEFILNDTQLLIPVPMTERIVVMGGQIIFQFADAVLSVQGTEERLQMILVELRLKGFVADAMPAQLVDRGSIEDL